MTACAIYSTFARQMDRLNAINSEIYTLDQQRDALARAFIRIVRHLTNGALGRRLDDYYGPSWDQFFTDAFLRTPGSRYLVLNLLAGDSVTGRRRVETTSILINESGLCVDERTGELLAKHADQTILSYFGNVVIPISGPVVDNHHTPRAVKAAWNAFATKDYAEILRMERELDALIAKSNTVNAEINALGATQIDTNGRDELISLLSSMDWTYDYADRPSRAMGEQEHKIRALLNEAPLDVALVLLVRHVGGYVQCVRSYLARHPELAQKAA